ncbi:DUF3426 domain-containing protein [Marinobacter sp. MDS2]|uniref:DUF3426 domain-containing protein n=1 Tax=Marinobacter sp. MDS2 TaxID=3065961 RepID=UPI00273CB824|nr:DUF3426 domain-containing protein [Marinobacter sp. MDS2]MDP4547468.1 DUF3426 domain-containing protein [Marinobacter sp. MDS2]
MTQSSLQTQCPECATRFRVTDEQLSVAGGKVRCGNCMAIFNANEHRIDLPGDTTTQPPHTDPEPSPSENSSRDDKRSSVIEDDFVFVDNPEEDAEEELYAGDKLTFSEDELSESFLSVDNRHNESFSEDHQDTINSNVDESWAEAMLSDDRPTAPEKPPHEPEPEPEPEPETASSSTGAVIEDESRTGNAAPLSEDTDQPDDPLINRTRPEPQTAALYQELRRDPVSVGRGGSRLRTILWGLVTLALFGLLVAQATWFQFDRLSAIPQLRPFYEKGCELAGCKLQPLVNVDAIQSRKLVVRTAPDNRNQLIVDAVIINRANFEQPFPSIALTFSNLNGDVVAQSVFSPDEYIAGDGEALENMPPDTPVKIAIRIRDPGRDAVNYNLLFRP